MRTNNHQILDCIRTYAPGPKLRLYNQPQLWHFPLIDCFAKRPSDCIHSHFLHGIWLELWDPYGHNCYFSVSIPVHQIRTMHSASHSLPSKLAIFQRLLSPFFPFLPPKITILSEKGYLLILFIGAVAWDVTHSVALKASLNLILFFSLLYRIPAHLVNAL